tara:strand:- start:55 stop:789 length:735 start_codon:yes stop_codon:yes gene_type:complete
VVEYCTTQNPELREQILLSYKPLILYIAKKLAYNPDDTQDLIQVGSIALLKALDRFDLSKEVDFASFVTPNIIGEIKHYFRDNNHLVKVPRKLQELYSKVKTEIRVAQKEGLSLRIEDLAQRLDVDEERILECMEAGQSTRVLSLDSPTYKTHDFMRRTHSHAGSTLINSVKTETKEDLLLNKEMLKQAIKKLPPRDRRVVYLRFYGGLSQAEIAARLELSQMHISRIILRAVQLLRKHLQEVI